ncbi:hypothetical protein M404DRAFT_1002115 [Pisolithus tinctorius Marx 270]|uniref:Uncharacterized protein n=1 Tax=Pisolithus tinctorius Marx 270 TaxID=870435 RepID=A0A0C3NNP5_PISTI|nr:hypothetical protein M404DRAFT_1002115 [Pisolithus tinctorius Marx 270]
MLGAAHVACRCMGGQLPDGMSLLLPLIDFGKRHVEGLSSYEDVFATHCNSKRVRTNLLYP